MTSRTKRAKERKIKLIKINGSKCSVCSYGKNYAALEFHHLDKKIKSFGLSYKGMTDTTWARVLAESKKCILLCANCHAELHNPACRLI